MLKKKKIIGSVMLAGILVMGTWGCGQQTKDSDQNQIAAAAASNVTYKAIEIVTDWETKATISLGDRIEIDGEGAQVQGDSILEITQGGAYILRGDMENGLIDVNTNEEVKLVLQGVSISNTTGPVIYGESSESIYIETVAGTQNILKDGSAYETDDSGNDIGKGTIFSNDDIVLSGEGTLVVEGNYKHGICSDDDIYVESGTVQVTAATDGLHANNVVCMDGGNLLVESASDGMQSEALVVINGGSISVTSQDEGIEGKDSIFVYDGDIIISCTDDGYNAGNALEINGGRSYVQTKAGDALDSNGTMVINDGLVVAYGGNAPEGGLDCDMSEVVINGGTVVATGDSNSAISNDSQQVSVLLGSFSGGDSIGILDEDGNTILAVKVPASSVNMIISTPVFLENESYQVYNGGTISGEETGLGYYKAGIYSGGSEWTSFTVDAKVVEAGGTANAMGGRGGQTQQPGGNDEIKPGENLQMQPGGRMNQQM